MKSIIPLLLLSLIFTSNNSFSQIIEDSIPAHQTFTIESKYVGETRIINVWTPPTYQSTSDSFPVMYMADGGIKEDFPHIANTLAKLIESKSIPPIILVGIENTQRRRDLTGPTENEKDKTIAPVVGGSEQLRAFIGEELFAEIESRYRTTDKKAIIGESLAGLFVTETFLLKPEMFDYYIAFDPSLWWNDEFLLKSANQQLKKFPTTQKTFWFTASSTKEILKSAEKLAKILKSENIKTVSWEYVPAPKEDHSTIFHATKESALIWMWNQN